MRNYIIIIVACLLSVMNVEGQGLNFKSPAVEGAVRRHLNISEGAALSFSQLDTITFLDLSHREVTDIQDVLLLPNLRVLDLSDNMVNDLHPIAMLDSLEYVDLSYNNLKDINDLFFSTARKLTVNVSFNYIKDFSLFCSLSSCSFTLDGTGLQLDEDAPYFDVYQFYADINKKGKPVVFYRGYANMNAKTYVKCNGAQRAATMDGDTYEATVPGSPIGASKVCLANSKIGDTIWVMPPLTYNVNNGERLIIQTGLPDKYQIGFISALHGTTSQADSGGTPWIDIEYNAPETVTNDTIYLSYYEGNQIRGFSQVYIINDDSPTGIDTPTEDDDTFTLSWNNGELVINNCTEDIESVYVYDGMGHLIGSYQRENFASPATTDMRISLQSVPDGIVIVQITAGDKKYLRKLAVR